MASVEDVRNEDGMDTTEIPPEVPASSPAATGPSIQVHKPEKSEEDMKDPNAKPPEVVVGTRRNANGTIGSVFSGNKIRHLKKEDGQPLWRKDIQYDFLKLVFEDQTKCFTDVDGTPGHTFSDLFIGAMQRSSKTSKVLKEKLLNEKDQAMRMAMICLLVNVGRMNTTLNFFPEMRAQLRTYHAIPCLQADQDPNAQYKGLQDAPRLKSILKGACEDTDEPNTIEKIRSTPIPRTNIVNLIFVLSQHVQKVSEIHFEKRQDFFDLVTPSNLSSDSRAKAFLWLMWWYMQSDFSTQDSLNNPFGPGRPSAEEPDEVPVKIPELIMLSDEEAALENVDPEEELAFGEEMRVARKKILDEDDLLPVKKTAGPSPARSEVGRTRENSPDGTPSVSRVRSTIDINALPKQATAFRLISKAGKDKQSDATNQVGSGPGSAGVNPSSLSRRSRPETSHQKAVNLNRKMRVDKILHETWKTETKELRKKRDRSGVSPLYQEIKRVYYLPDEYDTEAEDEAIGPGGITPNMYTKGLNEEDDFGGYAHHYKRVLHRSVRRLARQDGIESPKFEQVEAVIVQPPQTNGTRSILPAKSRARPANKKAVQSAGKGRSGQTTILDDLDMDILGEIPERSEDRNHAEEAFSDAEPYDDYASASIASDEGDETEDDFSYADPYAGVK